MKNLEKVGDLSWHDLQKWNFIFQVSANWKFAQQWLKRDVLFSLLDLDQNTTRLCCTYFISPSDMYILTNSPYTCTTKHTWSSREGKKWKIKWNVACHKVMYHFSFTCVYARKYFLCLSLCAIFPCWRWQAEFFFVWLLHMPAEFHDDDDYLCPPLVSFASVCVCVHADALRIDVINAQKLYTQELNMRDLRRNGGKQLDPFSVPMKLCYKIYVRLFFWRYE